MEEAASSSGTAVQEQLQQVEALLSEAAALSQEVLTAKVALEEQSGRFTEALQPAATVPVQPYQARMFHERNAGGHAASSRILLPKNVRFCKAPGFRSWKPLLPSADARLMKRSAPSA
jgi:hypothetical protein